LATIEAKGPFSFLDRFLSSEAVKVTTAQPNFSDAAAEREKENFFDEPDFLLLSIDKKILTCRSTSDETESHSSYV
jgi:hypothetical protein